AAHRVGPAPSPCDVWVNSPGGAAQLKIRLPAGGRRARRRSATADITGEREVVVCSADGDELPVRLDENRRSLSPQRPHRREGGRNGGARGECLVERAIGFVAHQAKEGRRVARLGAAG